MLVFSPIGGVLPQHRFQRDFPPRHLLHNGNGFLFHFRNEQRFLFFYHPHQFFGGDPTFMAIASFVSYPPSDHVRHTMFREGDVNSVLHIIYMVEHVMREEGGGRRRVQRGYEINGGQRPLEE